MRFDMSDMVTNMASHRDRIQEAILLYGETAGLKLEAEAKRNAKWENRTSNARNSIKGGADRTGNGATIYLSGNMEYSKFLENNNDGKFAILEPTLKDNEEKILQGLSRLYE